MSKEDKRFLIAAFLVSFAVRLWAIVRGSGPLMLDQIYDVAAVQLAQSGTFYPTATYSPVYPLFLSFWYLLFGHNYLIVQIAQALLSSFAAILIYFIAQYLFNKKTAVISTILYVFYLTFIFMPRILITENLYCFLLLLFIFYFLKYLKRPGKKDIFISGLLFSLAVLTRPVFFLFFFFILPALFLVKKKDKKFRAQLLIFIVIFSLPILAWSLRNSVLFKKPVFLTTIVGRSLYASWNPYQGRIYGVWAYDDLDQAVVNSGLDEVEQNKVFFRAALASIKNNLQNIPRLLILKMLYFFSFFDWEIIGYSVFNVSYFFILPFGIIGMWAGRNKLSAAWPVYLFILYTLVISLVFYGSPRFRMPIEPFLIMFAGFGLDIGCRRLRNKNICFILISGWLIVSLLLWLFMDKFKFLLKVFFHNLALW